MIDFTGESNASEVMAGESASGLRFLQVNNNPPDTNTNNKTRLLKLAKLPRLYRLLRILRLFKMMRFLKYNRSVKTLFEQIKVNPAYTKMLTVSVTVLFLVHLVSCFYFLIASFTDFDPDCWVVREGLVDKENFD